MTLSQQNPAITIASFCWKLNKHMFANRPPSSLVMGDDHPRPHREVVAKRVATKECGLPIQWVGYDLLP